MKLISVKCDSRSKALSYINIDLIESVSPSKSEGKETTRIIMASGKIHFALCTVDQLITGMHNLSPDDWYEEQL